MKKTGKQSFFVLATTSTISMTLLSMMSSTPIYADTSSVSKVSDTSISQSDKRSSVQETTSNISSQKSSVSKVSGNAKNNAQTDKSVVQQSSVKNGWVTENGVVRYYKNGQAVTGSQQINSKWYYFDNTGKRVTGNITLQGKLYRYDETTGQRVTGYVWMSGGMYYFDQNTGAAIKGERYYGNHKMEYYGNDYKQIRNAYVKTGNTYYYMKSNGDAVQGVRQYGKGKLEYYASDFKQVRNGYAQSATGRYYLGSNGDALKGKRYVGNKIEYYGSDYKQAINEYEWIDKSLYYFDKTGYAIKGIRYYGNHKMEYYGNDYKQIRGAYVKTGNTYYYMKSNGDAVVGLRQYGNGKLEYYASDFKQVRNKVITVSDKRYTINAQGDITKVENLGQHGVKIDKVISWFKNHEGKITYSMYGSRNGADGTADCSGSMTQALYEAGASKYTMLYTTETIHTYLKNNGFKLVCQNAYSWNAMRGDIVIWGKLGESGGAGGHIGMITTTEDDPYFISTNYSTGGKKNTAITEVRYNEYASRAGWPYYYVYRYE